MSKTLAAYSIWLGFDPREAAAFAVTRQSFRRNAAAIPIFGLVLPRLQAAGLYWRPTEKRQGLLYDVISEHPMASEFAISRFLVPILARSGWAMFADCDMLMRPNADLFTLFMEIERTMSDKAIVCVKHDHRPMGLTKMDNQVQSAYSRKNWSSLMFFNVDHPANKALTVDLINSVPGRDLHRFCWLDGADDLIGELPVEWNWLVGHSSNDVDPKNVHFTSGTPVMSGYENVPYADDFRNELYDWAQGASSLPG